ncbi:MAG: GNAT family N-acetyltransferase [Flavobacteriales bacterium]|nr:GNAT family N-acetyltransferase [Flavobacteriales bacterium]
MEIEDLGLLSVGSQMRRIYEKLQADADKVYKGIGTTFKSSWFPVYYVLSNSNRALTVMEITQGISFSRITVKNVVREMEVSAYVDILPNPTDNRSKLIRLNEKGRDLESKLIDVWQGFHTYLEQLFGERANEFLNHLHQTNQKLQENPMEMAVLKHYHAYSVRNAKPEEFERVGELLVEVYSEVKGFPDKDEQPQYYDMLRNVGQLTKNDRIELLVAVSQHGEIGGAVVYFNDMQDYGSGGTAPQEKNACGFRLLGVDPKTRGLGLGKMLTEYCLEKGKSSECETMVIHTTKSMKLAWGMYERLGFNRATDLDFMQDKLPVFGFRLALK